jgi:beta-galactosidase
MKRLLLLCALAVPLAAQPVDVVRSADPADAVALGGDWAFRYFPAATAGADEAFFAPDFDVAAWARLRVPGHWELHGFAEPKYKRVDEGTGLYRRTFRVPAGWTGGRVLLRFDGVQYGFTAWVNGRPVGEWASSYNPATFDITDAVRRDADNVLAVRVTTRSKGWEFDTNDCWALSGIHREVTLLRVPALHLQDHTVRTLVRSDGAAELQLDLQASGPGRVEARLLTPDGALERAWEIALDPRGAGRSSVAIPRARLWTAETPALYRLQLALAGPDGAVHRVTDRVGLRTVTVEDGILKLNGVALKLRGVNHHEIWPEEGRVATEERLRRDLVMMREANVNFVRTAHYPPHPRLVELCDELGLYVMCEVPFGFGDRNLADPTFGPVLRTRARATVMRDKNRPSVLLWSIGNENPLTELGVMTAGYTRGLDPTRPVCIPTVGSYFRNNVEKFIALPEFVGVFAPHYPGPESATEQAQVLRRPIIYTEYSHSLGLAFDRTETLGEVFWREPRIAGGAVWMFQDQGIRRAVRDSGEPKLGAMYVWPDAEHYDDTAGTDGCDGIVYSDRTPQADYWQLRKVFAPVRLRERSLAVEAGRREVVLHVDNRHDFRALAGMTLRWSLKVNGAGVQQGTRPLTAPARGTEAVALALDVPAGVAGEFCWLEVAFLDESGRALTEHALRLLPPAAAAPPAARLGLAAAGALRLEREGALSRVVHRDFTVTLRHDTGEVGILSASGRPLATGLGPSAGRRFTLADTLRVEREQRDATESALRDAPTSIWTGVPSVPARLTQAEATLADGAARIVVRGAYPRLDAPAQALEGGLTLVVSADGRIAVDYAFTPVDGTGTLLEAGLALALPDGFTEFRWVGAGPHAGYPGKEALNEFGVHHLTRGDLRFQGNRRGVQVAALTDGTGAGLALLGADMDVATEEQASGVRLSHNAQVAGRGNKGGSPDVQVKVPSVGRIEGRFTLVPLAPAWPDALRRWLGPPEARVAKFAPFLRSYDQ